MRDWQNTEQAYFWFNYLQDAIRHAQPGLILEFGVASGRSIRFIAGLVPDRRVVGFDWFGGLPEGWKENPTGTFACARPTGLPANVEIVEGLFSETLPVWLDQNQGPVAFVNMDADLYSSTDFVLRHIEKRFLAGTVIHFDEILGHPGNVAAEGRAFNECLDRTLMDCSLITKTGTEGALFRLGGSNANEAGQG